MKVEGLETLSDNDIVARRTEVMRDLVRAQLRLRTGQLEDTSVLGKTRKVLAQMNTELRAREIAQNLPKGTLLNSSVAKADGPENEGGPEGVTSAKRSRFGLGFLKDALMGKRSE